ncbi:septum site-determining protein MinC [Cribrihabitans pelagius]|uniref:septum site-determining protein MinC n=1 Tax=Cribrihabitans pelagius TaxID=1765746 RepID=UPI003B5BD8B3
MPDQDSTNGAVATAARFQIRGRFLTAIALRLADGPQDDAFFASLDQQLQKLPHFYANAPMVLDLEHTAGLTGEADLAKLAGHLRERNLSVFGVQNPSTGQAEAARAAGLITVSGGKDSTLPSGREKPQVPKKLQPPQNKVITAPVRSGQTVIAEGGDLTVIGPVSSGAELIARGSIHVYGRLSGRAMAGAHGDESARIFCQKLDAELLAVAGLYRTSEHLGAEIRGRYVQAYLEDGRLCVETLG